MFTQPIKGKDFFGRTDVLDILSKRVGALRSGYRQNVALTGQMLSGKSSILQHFLYSLRDKSIVPIYVEIRDKSFAAFAEKFMATVLYTYLQSENIIVTQHMDDLIKESDKVIPETTRAIKAIKAHIQKRKHNIAYRELLDITSILKNETGKPCVVILDEFHNLGNFKIKNPFIHLGKIIMLQKNTMYVVSSSQKNTVKKILAEKLSLLFGNFEMIEVSGFDRQTAKTFIKDRFSTGHISEYYVDYILNLTGRNPFYMDVLSKKLKELTQAKNTSRVNMEIMKEVLSETIYSATGTIHQLLASHLNFLLGRKNRKRYLSVLLALSQNKNKLKDIAGFCACDGKRLASCLDELIDIDLVEKKGVFYVLQDRLFEFWLKNVFLERENRLIDNEDDGINRFKNFVDSDIEAYLIEYNKSTAERLRDLFMAFSNDIIEVSRKRHRFLRFATVSILKYGEDMNYLVCKCKKAQKQWFFKVKEKRAGYGDVIDLIQRTSGKGKSNFSRRILVSFEGIDDSALLLAKEKGIWVWNAKTVNGLLRLYNKQNLR